MKAVPAFIIACVVACLLWCAPRAAWAGEYDDIPVGVLTLCDDPFAIDCGHNHSGNDGSSQVDHSVSPVCHPERSEESVGSPASPDMGPSLQAPSFAQDDTGGLLASPDGDSSLVIPSNGEPVLVIPRSGDSRDEGSPSDEESPYTPSSNDASTSASIPIASSGDARIIVDDEGLGRHEYATILAEVKPGISRAEFDALIASAGGLRADDVTDDDLVYGLVRLGVTDGSLVMDAVERISRMAGFLSAQPNFIYFSPMSDELAIDTDDLYSTRQWELDFINAHSAWGLAKVNGSVSVAVIDTGADLDHPDLASNIVATHNSLSSANSVEDQVGHGTHVAGLIAGVANNGLGIAGVSYNAGLVIVKASSFNSSEFDSASLARAYSWLESLDSSGKTVAEHYNIRVVNMSIGGYDEMRVSNTSDDILNRAIKKARDQYGILTVISAGNGLSPELPYLSYPSDSDACISVMNLCEVFSEFGDYLGVDLDESSNYNLPGSNYKDICAPGTDLCSTWINGKYAYDTGTSMAAPIVSGIAAMLFAVNPTLTPQMVMSILEFTATDMGDEGWDERYGYGAVNAAAAVRLASAAHIDGFSVVGRSGSAGFSASLGPGLTVDESGWTWKVINGTGAATVDENGVLTGTRAGEVTLVSTCRATTGAEISAMKTVTVLSASIIGDSYVYVGESSSPFTITDSSWTWVWQVENDTGGARIDQDAILVAEKAGVVYVTATCASNTDIVLRKKVTIVA